MDFDNGYTPEYPLISRFMREAADEANEARGEPPITTETHVNRLMSMRLYGAAEAALREHYSAKD